MTVNRCLLIGGAAAHGVAGAGWLGWRQMGSAFDMGDFAATLRQNLPATPGARDLIRHPTFSANSHTTQALRFRENPAGIDILPDPTRATPVVDPDDHPLFISLGGAAENLTLAMAARGRGGEVAFDPTSGTLSLPYGTISATDTALFDAIPIRQSTRSDYDGTPVSPADLGLLAAAATMPGVDLILITAPDQIARLSDLIVAANTARIADPAFVAELKHWRRFTPRAAMTTGDGLYSTARSSPALPERRGLRLFDAVFAAKSGNDKVARQIASSAGIAVFAGAAADPAHWVQVGRASQRFALQATAPGLKSADLHQPVEVAEFRADLANLSGLPGRRPDQLMRFGRGSAMPCSARRPVEAAIS